MGKQCVLPGTASGLRMGREEFRQWAMDKGIRAERVPAKSSLWFRNECAITGSSSMSPWH